MTSKGGAYAQGNIFSVDTDGSNYKDLLDFNGSNGSSPQGAVARSGKHLYGMTLAGGAYTYGVIFSIDTDGNNYKDMHDFDGLDGEAPYGSLIISGKRLYGMTSIGGINGVGNVFAIDTDGNNYKDLLDLNGTNGMTPYGDLTLSGSKLFGMTYKGGISGEGNIFTVDTAGNNIKELWDFIFPNGYIPYGSLIISGTQLFGMTFYGGIGDGNVFSIDTTGNNFKDLHDFNGPDGAFPGGGALTLLGGTLYGMTSNGGGPGKGNIFAVDSTGSGFTDVYDFDGVTAALPNGSLSPIGNSLYGFTTQGNPNNAGVIFKYSNPLCTLTLGTTAMENVSCNGGNNGIALATPAGGTTPYTYSWSPGGGTTNIISNLSAGTYTVIVFDNAGCSDVGTVTITEPNALTVTANTTNDAFCNGNADGHATATPSNGTKPYTYLWSGAGGTNANSLGVTAGTYTITVTDSCGNSATASTTITEPNAIVPNANVVSNVSCNGGNNGVADAIPTGGTGAYTYSWTPGGGTNQTQNGLSAGTYTITVTDSHGCTGTGTVTLSEPNPLTVTANTSNDVNCNGYADGHAGSIPSDGTRPYTYLWSGAGGTGINTVGVTAGTYTITVTDSCGNSATASTVITEPSVLTTIHDSVADNGSCNGIAVLVGNGGTPPYTYHWVTGNQTTDTIKGQCAGTYCCIIRDNHNCIFTDCVTINLTSGTNQLTMDNEQLTVYPNPSNGVFTIAFSHTADMAEPQKIEVYNILGQPIITEILPSTQPALTGTGGDYKVMDLSKQPNGIYLYRITKENGSLIREGKLIIQKQPARHLKNL